MSGELHDRVVNGLIDSGDADKPWSYTILAALDGADVLSAYLEGARTTLKPSTVIEETYAPGGSGRSAAGAPDTGPGA